MTARISNRKIFVKKLNHTLIIAAVFFAAVIVFNHFTGKVPEGETRFLLSDAFLIPGLLLLGGGLMKFASYHGCFDNFFFAVMKTVSFRSKKHDTYEERQKRSMTHADFCQQRALNRSFPTCSLLVGSMLLVLSVLCAII